MRKQRLDQRKAATINPGRSNDDKEQQASRRPPPKLLYALPLVIVVSATLLLRSRSRNGDRLAGSSSSPLSILQKRHFIAEAHSHASHNATTPITAPSYIPYHDIYVRLHPVLGITVLLIWLVFLFSFLGIVASDFFCPNLSTLASRLGLPDDVAGATLVGFANGAPDMFSTFASLNAGSASLAIGELIGAASFICSVVAGSMVLVKPFKVGKYNFFRDVGFFTIAVAFSLAILRDGQIHAVEAKIMVGLYFVYVLLVSVGSLYRRRRRRQKERERLMRDAYRSEEFLHGEEGGAYSDNPNPDVPVLLENGHTLPKSGSHHSNYRTLPQLVIPPSENQGDYFTSGTAHSTAPTSPGLSPLATSASGVSESGPRPRSSTFTQAHTPGGSRKRPHGHSRSVSHNYQVHTPSRMLHRSSILGAIEFRDVVNSLQAESTAARTLGAFAFPSQASGEEDAPVLRNYPHLGRPKSVTGALSAPSARRRQSKSKKGSGDSYESRKSTRNAKRAESSQALESDDNKGRPRAVSSPPDRRAMLSSSSNNAGGPSMDDPWANASPSDKPDFTPSINVDEASEAFPDWTSSSNAGLSVPTNGSSGNRQQEGSESEQEDANSSDITARPFPTQRDSEENARQATSSKTGTAMSQFPSKALKVLGFGSSSQKNNNTVPPKAQRLLGLQEEPSSSSSPAAGNYKYSWKYAYAMLCAVIYAVFPTLHNFCKKSVLNMITSIITIPAILLLNITLPVVDESGAEEEFLEELEKERLSSEVGDNRENEDGDVDEDETEEQAINRYVDEEMDEEDREEREDMIKRSILIAQELRSPVATHQQHHGHTHSHHFSSFMAPDPSNDTLVPPTPTFPTYARSATPDSLVLDNFEQPAATPAANIPSLPSLEDGQTLKLGNDYIVEAEDLTTCLTAIQCLLAPIFAVLAVLGDNLEVWYLPAATGVGLLLSLISILFFRDDHHHITRVLSLCSIGFFIAIVWILSIVNEVVGILQTVGHVFGLSDAILGLTIFAMGNSLGDLVANVTVARMGYPLMALSACFGGPMLNILLGIGLSGTYLTSRTHQPVHVQMSTTLIVSGISLLVVLVGTLITVPLNGYVMSRRWALGLISVYVLVMTANVIVEINSEKRA